MADEGKQLLVDLEIRTTQAERSIERMNKRLGDFNGMTEKSKRSAKVLDDAFSNVGNKARGRAANLNDAFDTSGAAKGAQLTAMQFSILSAAARDGFASIASGQSVMTVLAQQGSNVQAAIGEDGVLGLLGGIGNGLKGLLTPATVAGSALVAVGAAGYLAFARYHDEAIQTELQLTGIGRAAGLTVDDIRRMGDELARTGSISSTSAREITTALAGTGKIQGPNLSAVAGLAPGYAQLFGGSMSEAGKALASIFADPAKGAETLDARLGVLDAKTRAYIRTLAEQGDRQGAIAALVRAVQPELERAASLTSAWAKTWQAVKSSADAAANAVGRAIERATNGPGLKEQLAQLKAKRDGSEAGYVAELKRQGLDDKAIQGIVPTYRPQDTAKIDAEIAAIEGLIKAEEELAKARAEEARTAAASKAAADIVDLLSEEGEAVRSLQNRYEALGKALADPAVLARMDDAGKARAAYDALGDRVRLLAEDYKAGGAAAAAALRAANFSSATAGLSSYKKGLEAINEQYNEQIRLARLSGDAATTAARVATLEAARGAAVGAYNKESQERARQSVALPSDYVAGVIAAESSGDANAKNSRSSATGLGQFISSTWLSLFKKVNSELTAGMSDEAILALRTNKQYSMQMIEEYSKQNGADLARAGFDSTSRNLHLAHFLGSGGAIKALRADPSDNAASVLGAGAAAANPTIIGGGRSIADVLAYAERRAQRGSAGKATQDRVVALQAETEALGKSADATERLKAIQEQLDQDRERSGDLSAKYATAEALLKAKSDELTPALAAQRAEILALADARAKAAATGLGARFDRDMADQRAALGRTASQQAAYQTVRSYGIDPASDAGRTAQSVVQLNSALADTKAAATGALSGFLTDLAHGKSLTEALQSALMGMLDKLINKLADSLISGLFSGIGGATGGTGGAGGGILGILGSLFGGGFADGGMISGPGGPRSDSILAAVSNGEFVVNADATRKYGRLLEAINTGNLPRFANGGLVGAAAMSAPELASAGGAGSVTVQTPINITVASGSQGPQADAKLAESIGKHVENSVRAIVASELRTQLRPGGMLRGR